MTAKYKTPGVYVDELNAFPNSVRPVETAIPVFIGYTPQASYEGKTYLNVPTKITSFKAFKKIYCYPELSEPAISKKQYQPQYYLVKQENKPIEGDYIIIAGVFYTIVPDPNTIYYMYNSIRLFYLNGGTDAYIMAVGTYGEPSHVPMHPQDQIVNPNVQLQDLLNGITLLKKEQEPTMYICPEATLLSVKDNATLMQAMLLQNSEMRTAISILDIIGARNPNPITYTKYIDLFRSNTGTKGLSFGCAYFPFIETTIMQYTGVDFTNLFGGDINSLESILNTTEKPNLEVVKLCEAISIGNTDLTIQQFHEALKNASSSYTTLINKVLQIANILPPSGAIAGVISTIDNQEGVWKAPANTSITGAVSLPLDLNDMQQVDLNVDPISGKSINVIRSFNRKGILIWGARTLDGNSNDWRYIPVRRFLILIEQTCKLIIKSVVFEPNDSNTWLIIKRKITAFLTSFWREGAMPGNKIEDVFFVNCGLNETMSNQDILNDVLLVSVGVVVIHPKEFIVLSLSQKMLTSN